MIALALFAVAAFAKALGGDVPTATDFEWSWLSLFSIESFSALAAALSLSIFIYWGWTPPSRPTRRRATAIARRGWRRSAPSPSWW